MAGFETPSRGDVYLIKKSSGLQVYFLVITPTEINALGSCISVPIIPMEFSLTKSVGLSVPVIGSDVLGVAVCNQVRSFDIISKLQSGLATLVETLRQEQVSEVIEAVLNTIDPVTA